MRNCEFRKTATGFDAEASCGSSIDRSLKECVAKAQSSGATVTLRSFNGVDVVVTPTTTAEEAEAAWRAAMDHNAEEYRNSPAGRKAAQEAEERLNRSQRECDRLLAQLEDYGDHPTTDQIVAWVAEFSEHADHTGVKYDMSALIVNLEDFGYVANAHVAKTEQEKNVKNWSRQTMGEYIIGQAISCMKSGMPPHPGLTPQFAKEYAEMR